MTLVVCETIAFNEPKVFLKLKKVHLKKKVLVW